MKQIPLSGKHGVGKFALVDDEDYEFLMQWRWYLGVEGYARRDIHICRINGKTVTKNFKMHRLIIKAKDGEHVDHKNNDRLDNKKENLRIATRSNNSCNRNKNRGVYSSKFKGVSISHWHKEKWLSRIQVNKKPFLLGVFDKEIEAAIAYNEAAIKMHGKFAKLNIIPPN